MSGAPATGGGGARTGAAEDMSGKSEEDGCDAAEMKRDEAEASLRSAVDYARRQQARSFELRAATSLARVLHVTRRTRDARGTLAGIFASFTEGLDTLDLVTARNLLSEIA